MKSHLVMISAYVTSAFIHNACTLTKVPRLLESVFLGDTNVCVILYAVGTVLLAGCVG
jgi:hypothetical protein